MDTTSIPVELHLHTDARNLAMTVASMRLLEQKETVQKIHMLRQEACSGQMHDHARVLT